MKKRIFGIAMALTLIMVMAMPMGVGAADTGTITCTVTGTLVSLTVTDGTVAYGTLGVGGTQDTLAAHLNDLQTAKNTGTVAETFTIKSGNATGGTTPWTLAATQGDNQFFHKFSTNSGTLWTAMDGTGVELAHTVTPSNTQTFDLQIGMPTVVTDYTEHTITVTVTATQHS